MKIRLKQNIYIYILNRKWKINNANKYVILRKKTNKNEKISKYTRIINEIKIRSKIHNDYWNDIWHHREKVVERGSTSRTIVRANIRVRQPNRRLHPSREVASIRSAARS